MNTLTEQGSWSHSTNNRQHKIAVYSAMRCLYSHHDSHYYYWTEVSFYLHEYCCLWFEGYSFCHTFCRFDDSAQYYAQTRMSFEEVALKFIETKKDVALRVYLEKKLKSYKPAEVRQCFCGKNIHLPWFRQKIHKCKLIILSKANANARSKMSSVFRTRCKSQC